MPLQQDIRFCTTTDGVRIASASNGAGPPLVRAGTWMNHLELEAQEGDSIERLEALGRRNTVVRYDARGCGLSDRHVDGVTFEGMMRDLEAVVDSRGLERFSLFGMSAGAGLAVAYAVRHPQRVDKMVLLNGFARSYFSGAGVTPEQRAEAELLLENARVGWGNPKGVFRHVFVAQMLGSASPEQQRVLDQRMRESMSAEMAVAHLRCNFASDVKALCPQVQCPTLVFHCRGDEMVNFEQGRKLAAAIPGARLVPLEFDGHHLLWNAPAARVFEREVEAFLHPGAGATAHLTDRQRQVLQAVAAGRTDKEVARELGLSPRTVEMHMAGALKALGCATRSEAVAKATAARLLG